MNVRPTSARHDIRPWLANRARKKPWKRKWSVTNICAQAPPLTPRTRHMHTDGVRGVHTRNAATIPSHARGPNLQHAQGRLVLDEFSSFILSFFFFCGLVIIKLICCCRCRYRCGVFEKEQYFKGAFACCHIHPWRDLQWCKPLASALFRMR